ncbi:MAG: hypothetical protein ACO1RX_07425 [Candidatus Sericytochromatia bacterium]
MKFSALSLSAHVFTCLLLSACGREVVHVGAPFPYAPVLNHSDLGAQNRQSLQGGTSFSYIYVPPQGDTPSAEAESGAETTELVLEPAELEAGTSTTEEPALPRQAPANRPAARPAAVVPSYPRATAFALEDLRGTKQYFSFPRSQPLVLALADREGAEQMEPWIKPLYARYPSQIEIHGIAELSAVPGFARGIARGIIGSLVSQPIMLDWSGDVVKQFGAAKGQTVLVLLSPSGEIRLRVQGAYTAASFERLTAAVDTVLAQEAAAPSP